MEKIITHFDKKAMKELLKRQIIFMIICIVLGAGCCALYIVFSLLNNNWAEPLNVVDLVIGLLIIGFSIFLLFRYHRIINTMGASEVDYIIDMNNEYIHGEAYQNNEKTSEFKVDYEDIISYTITEHYIFLKFENNTLLPISRNEEAVDLLIKKGLKRK